MALVTTQSKPFLQLVDLQQQSLDALNKIKDSVTLSAEQQNADTQRQSLEQLRKILDVQQDHFKIAKKNTADMTAQITSMNEKMKKWKTWGDKARDMKQGVADTFDASNLKDSLLKALNVGGMMNQKIQANDYMKRQKDLGLDKGRTSKELKSDAADYAASQREAMLAQQKIDRLKARGSSDEEIKNSPVGKKLYQQREAAASNVKSLDAGNKMGGNVPNASDTLVKTPSDKGQVAQSTTDVLAEQQVSKENQMESLRVLGDQTKLLQQIADNTAAAIGRKQIAVGADGNSDDSGLGSIGKTMKGLGSGISSLGKGIGLAIGSVFTGIMEGIANGIAAFGKGAVLKGVVVLGLMTAVLWGVGAVLKTFEKLDWETITKGLGSLAIIGVIGGLAGMAAGPIALGAGALALMGGSLYLIGEAMSVMGTGLKDFVDGLERLGNIDGDKLNNVADSLKGMGLALAAFGAGEAAAGLGNLVSRFLTIGSDSPVEQLIKIGTVGPGVEQAAKGLDALSDTMVKFSQVSPDSMQAVNDFPWMKATAFVAAGGSMSVNGAKVYNQSKTVEDEKAAVDGQKNQPAVQSSSVAVQNNSTTNTTVKPNVRNQESSQARYIAARY